MANEWIVEIGITKKQGNADVKWLPFVEAIPFATKLEAEGYCKYNMYEEWHKESEDVFQFRAAPITEQYRVARKEYESVWTRNDNL